MRTYNLRTYNLFISHSWAHSDAYERLIDLLDARRPRFFYSDYSVPKNDPIHTNGTDSATLSCHKESR